ncbi:hypothetical protein CUN91_00525 [Candidatus Carsonella ruddii]|uniref:ornithine carbamoyltransferase n=1 Tax=Carsonella ruddii TaxID=114186 RepID=A0A2K8K4A6_CARRU|nr:hypothetical protein [Candidatus Carsonella ruddii]ATX33440.1 hypothetical protein CUN91_00525 [Candidatus Carsonella ruddii]
MNFYNKHLLNDFNLKKYEILSILETIKKSHCLSFFNKKICIINEKQSLRTINSLINSLNFLNLKFTIINNKHNIKKENIKDFSKTLGLLYDYIFIRSNNDNIVKIISKNSGSIIINILSNGFHPIQAIGDLYFLKKKIIYLFGDFNSNVFRSIIINLSKLNKNIIIFSPKIYWNFIFLKKIFNKKKIIITEKLIISKKKCIIYNDVWFSMGESDNFINKIKKLINFQINKKILKILKIEKIFHCLPCFKNIKIKKTKFESELTKNVFESNFSFFEKQIIKKISIIKSYIILGEKTFFKVLN